VGYGGDSSSAFEISNNENGAINFRTNATFAMGIANTGYVGIGVGNPTNLLHVSKDLPGEAIALIANTSATGFGLAISSGGGTRYVLSLKDYANNPISTFLANGNVLIGTVTDNGRKLQVSGNMSVGDSTQFSAYRTTYQNSQNGFAFGINNACTQFEFLNGAPAVIATINGITGTYVPTSDINKKKDFEDSTIGLNEVLQLKPTLYRMKADDESEPKQLGFIAQEVKLCIPQAYVESGEEDNKFIGLNFNPIVAALAKAIQEQQAQIEELKAMIAAK
jgi:hypothetical protein